MGVIVLQRVLIGKLIRIDKHGMSESGVSRQVYTGAQTESYTKHGQTDRHNKRIRVD